MPKRSDDGLGVLRVHGEGGAPVETITGLLRAFDNAYSGILLHEIALKRAASYFERHDKVWRQWGPPFPPYAPPFDSGQFLMISSLPAGSRLILHGVELRSPGAWDFLGKWNPLEVIRQYLCDHHERQKDRMYRNDAEKERLAMDNMIKGMKVIADYIEVLRKAGASDEDLAQVRTRLIHEPVSILIGYQDKGLISKAEFPDKSNPERL